MTASGRLFDAFQVRQDNSGWLLVAMVAAVLWRAYRRRGAGATRVMLFAAVFAFMLPWLGWRPPSAPGGRFKTGRIGFARSRPKQVGARAPEPDRGLVRMGYELPIAISGVPAGALWRIERARTEIEVPGGMWWNSGWVRQREGWYTAPPETYPLSLPVEVDAKFYRAARLDTEYVRLRAEIEAWVWPRSRFVRLTAPSAMQRVAPGEYCEVTVDARVNVRCLYTESSESSPNPLREYWLVAGGRKQEFTGERGFSRTSIWTTYTGWTTPEFAPEAVEVETHAQPEQFEQKLTAEGLELWPDLAPRKLPLDR